jgi:hypothetical protein
MHKIKNIANRKDVECHKWEKFIGCLLAKHLHNAKQVYGKGVDSIEIRFERQRGAGFAIPKLLFCLFLERDHHIIIQGNIYNPSILQSSRFIVRPRKIEFESSFF